MLGIQRKAQSLPSAWIPPAAFVSLGLDTIVSASMNLSSWVLRASGYGSSRSAWEKPGFRLEAKPGRAQHKGMGKLSPAVSWSSQVPLCPTCDWHRLALVPSVLPWTQAVMAICNLCDPAPQMDEWLVEEITPVTLGLCFEQEASFLSFYLPISNFLFLGSSLTLFLPPTDGDRGWSCSIAQGFRTGQGYWMLALTWWHPNHADVLGVFRRTFSDIPSPFLLCIKSLASLQKLSISWIIS